jgi:hypothetical protein
MAYREPVSISGMEGFGPFVSLLRSPEVNLLSSGLQLDHVPPDLYSLTFLLQ